MLVPLGTVTALMVVMVAKHFCADFLFQTSWMAHGKNAPRDWLWPLTLHAGTHALLTLLVALLTFPTLWWIAVAEFFVHAAIDRAKAVVGRRQKLDASRASFWWLLGFDQFLHQLTNIAIVFGFLALGQGGA